MATTMIGAGLAVSGAISDAILANRKVIDMRDKLYLLQPE